MSSNNKTESWRERLGALNDIGKSAVKVTYVFLGTVAASVAYSGIKDFLGPHHRFYVSRPITGAEGYMSYLGGCAVLAGMYFGGKKLYEYSKPESRLAEELKKNNFTDTLPHIRYKIKSEISLTGDAGTVLRNRAYKAKITGLRFKKILSEFNEGNVTNPNKVMKKALDQIVAKREEIYALNILHARCTNVTFASNKEVAKEAEKANVLSKLKEKTTGNILTRGYWNKYNRYLADEKEKSVFHLYNTGVRSEAYNEKKSDVEARLRKASEDLIKRQDELVSFMTGRTVSEKIKTEAAEAVKPIVPENLNKQFNTFVSNFEKNFDNADKKQRIMSFLFK